MSYLARCTHPALSPDIRNAIDTRALEQAYRDDTRRACHRGVRVANLLGILFVPAAVLLDHRMAPATAALFLWFRGATLAALLVVQAVLATRFGRRHPQGVGLVGASICAGVDVLLTVFTGGYDSPYNPGISVVVFVTALLVPSPWLTLRLCAVVAGFLGLRALVIPSSGRYVFASLFGFATAGAISVLATVIVERLRRRDFELRWTLGSLLDQLGQAERLRSEFLATVSHELRTPLQVVLGYTEMLRERSWDNSTRDDFVARIEHAGRELLDTVDSTLTVARLEAGHEEVRPTSFALPVFWRDLQDRCEVMPRAPGVAVVWSDAPPLTLETDPRHLLVILRNLTSNAYKFTERGAVDVSARSQGDDVVFEVRDTGIGIPADASGAIFEMFRQVDSSDARRYGGVGLGLYIVRRFVHQLGGHVTVESVVGQGATFRVTIPQVLRVPSATPNAADGPPTGSVVNGS